jgi:hypothetical protein
MLVQMMMQVISDYGVHDNKSLTNAPHIYKILKYWQLIIMNMHLFHMFLH